MIENQQYFLYRNIFKLKITTYICVYYNLYMLLQLTKLLLIIIKIIFKYSYNIIYNIIRYITWEKTQYIFNIFEKSYH